LLRSAIASRTIRLAFLGEEALLDLHPIGLQERNFVEAFPQHFFGAFIGCFGFAGTLLLNLLSHKFVIRVCG
jgi:hypothetical protein